MNGAECLLKTLVNGGVDVCFTNPGTTEMHFVAAVDRVEGMRCILGLFEGVVSGAADGYARMTDKPAVTLLHLGPGLANGLANFHNARKANVPIISVVGEHATYHRECDPPLHSDISAFAKTVSGWVECVESPDQIPVASHAAIQASLTPPSQIATLILPADCTWEESNPPSTEPVVSPVYQKASDEVIKAAATALRTGKQTAILLGGRVLRQKGLNLAGKIAAKCNARLFCDTINARLERGAGLTPVFSLPYFAEKTVEILTGLDHLVIVGTKPPVSFFAYPDLPNRLTPSGCEIHMLARPEQDCLEALERLVDEIDATNEIPRVLDLKPMGLPTGELNPQSIGQSVAALLPEHSIVIDEGISSTLPLSAITATSMPHDWLGIAGGSIGDGMPLATGAAVACPDRKVLCLESDGSGMYTLQALWTQARESLDVTTVIFANRAYRILAMEHQRIGAGDPGPKAHDIMSLDRPELDWVSLATGLGVPARRVTSAEEFNQCLEAFLKEPGPNLIEAII